MRIAMYALCSITLGTALLLGGGTHAGFLGDVSTQLLSVFLLLAAIWHSAERSDGARPWLTISILATVTLLFALYLVPLPESWSDLGRPLRASLSFPLGTPTRALLSLSPEATWAAAISLLPPIAVFAATTQLTAPQRINLARLVIIAGGLALLVGLLQVAQGPQSFLRFFAITNPSEAVGFFANRNHFAAQLYVTLVLSLVWFLPLVRDRRGTLALDNRSLLSLSAAIAFLIATIVGLAMARSRAGIVLAMAAILAAPLIAVRTQPTTAKRERWSAARITVLIVLFATLFAAQFGLQRVLTRFEVDPIEDLRIPLARTTLETVWAALPFGTGPGTFVPVYATVEHASDVFTGYANRAHNDIAEFALEAGGVGIALMALFLIWYLARTIAVWRRTRTSDPHDLLQLASTVVIMLLLAHSLVDYPLRTTAMACVFAFACGVLLKPAPAPVENTAHERPKRAKRAAPTPPKPQPRSSWTPTSDWPEAWHKPSLDKTPQKDFKAQKWDRNEGSGPDS